MQILPGSSDDAVLIDVSGQLCNGSNEMVQNDMSPAAELGGTNYILNLSRCAISNVSHGARASLPSLYLMHDNVNRTTPVSGPDPA